MLHSKILFCYSIYRKYININVNSLPKYDICDNDISIMSVCKVMSKNYIAK